MLSISRSHGIIFEQAWDSAWVRVRWPHDTEHRKDFKKVLEELRAYWEDAYELRGVRNRHLEALAALLDAVEHAQAA
jgi:hypothetical protein